MEKLIFDIDDLLIDSLNANVLIKDSQKTKEEEESSGKLPIITANKIKINNSIVN